MISFLRRHRDRLRLLQSLELEVQSLSLQLKLRDQELLLLRSQTESLRSRALEAEARRDSEGNGYRSQLEDMRKQMDWMARRTGNGPIFDRQLAEGRVGAAGPETMDEVVETFDPEEKAAFAQFLSDGGEFLRQLEMEEDR